MLASLGTCIGDTILNNSSLLIMAAAARVSEERGGGGGRGSAEREKFKESEKP